MAQMFNRPVQQIAYFTDDIAAAAARHSALFGSGPYVVSRNIPLTLCLHRGRPTTLVHSSAYGQWGEVMVEFVQQDSEGPSVFTDLYPEPGTGGVHHLAIIVDDLQAELARLNAAGMETALYAELGGGLAFAMVDATREQGVFIELYEPSPPLLALYARVRKAHQEWDGAELFL